MNKLQNEISQILTEFTLEIDNAATLLAPDRINNRGNIAEFVRLRTEAHMKAQNALDKLYVDTYTKT